MTNNMVVEVDAPSQQCVVCGEEFPLSKNFIRFWCSVTCLVWGQLSGRIPWRRR